MKKTPTLFAKLLRLAQGESLPASALRGEWFDQMIADGILVATTHGSRKHLRAISESALRNFLAIHCEIRHLETAIQLLNSDNPDRASQVTATGDSKFLHRRTFTGFLVNSYQPIEASLHGMPFIIAPPEGSYVFIADYTAFTVADDVVIVGMENAENFRHIARQRHLFEPFGKVLFVSRYPQNGDLVRWLTGIGNHYVHFGDLDLAGIAIFQNEFYSRLGQRASMLIPADYETRIAHGSRERYDTQWPKYGNISPTDKRVEPLLECLHRHRRGYDQEGYIVMDNG
ncbi:MAG: hypothetical protein IKR25_06025 [Muribaculaceae bacterium]|nr:hypothetical protein [Muribaculaceae bacterium]